MNYTQFKCFEKHHLIKTSNQKQNNHLKSWQILNNTKKLQLAKIEFWLYFDKFSFELKTNKEIKTHKKDSYLSIVKQ